MTDEPDLMTLHSASSSMCSVDQILVLNRIPLFRNNASCFHHNFLRKYEDINRWQSHADNPYLPKPQLRQTWKASLSALDISTNLLL